ncbi:ShlB/FhaC/HecB family hemolysin secretion/activation protein [Pseudanabaena sp. CCNP1317]|uniref:ShlB/FhaC/HecB family hemolysin secretion/activation protein n=1 Tax=Pseudanabaena sp. CCNP1317 TaxID=3110253 RepID=UPI002B21184A|nr:ShlB/FhaC/HecB family hemolysin secretion/activation protein [Pseudanabaena sp. CCNP1317]MEA5485934.1 ShlB/FhaC/HecB family hemolysin secretion/activation protein [Pseudanabaena sp. CCNP1317]
MITIFCYGVTNIAINSNAIAQSAPTSQQPAEDTFTITDVIFSESRIYTDEDWEPYRRAIRWKDDMTVKKIEAILEQLIYELYINKGYITSRVELASNKTDHLHRIVKINILEGGLCNIFPNKSQPTTRLNINYILDRIQIPNTIPLSVNRLEDQLRLLKNDPQFENVEFTLEPSALDEPCQHKPAFPRNSNLFVLVKEANPLSISTSINNYSPPSVGGEQIGVNASHQNLTGMGDRLSFNYNRSFTGGSNVYDFSYTTPLNPMNGSLNLRTALTRSTITEAPFDRFGIAAKSQLYEIQYRQPFIRSFVEEFALSFGFTAKDGQTFLFNNLATPFGFGADVNGITRTSVFSFGQDYLKRDEQGAWFFQSVFKLGTGLVNSTINQSPIPDSRFLNWNFQGQRWQRINDDNLLILQADLQVTPDSLLPSEQFIVGGGQTLRGYRQSARSGDNGLRFSAENRITLQRNGAGQSIFQIAPFFNMGSVWNRDDNPNFLSGKNFLMSFGTGIIWEPLKNLNMRLDYAIPITSIDDRGNNLQDKGINFSFNYKF